MEWDFGKTGDANGGIFAKRGRQLGNALRPPGYYAITVNLETETIGN